MSTSPSRQAELSTARPPRTLNFTGLIGLTFFCVAGGAFGLEDAVGAAGPFFVLLMIVLLPWLWSFPTALMTAELSTAMPEDGGYVVWVERAFGRFWAFQEGWLSWLCSFADNALYPVMFVDYLAYLRGDMSPLERWLMGIGMISIITWLNTRGIRLVGLSSIVFTLLVLAPFVCMVVLGAPQIEPSIWLTRTVSIDWALLLSTVLWNTSGWDNAGCCAGEVKEPNRAYPRAMILTVFLVTLVYLLPVGVGVSADTRWSEWREGYFPQVAEEISGPWLGIWLTLAGLVSASGLFNALLCTSSRVSYAMACRRMLPQGLGRLHPRYATPVVSILVNAIGVALLIPFSFQELIQVDMFLYALALVLEFAALIWLRFKEPDMARPFRVPFGKPGVFALSIPPLTLCLVSIAVANAATKIVCLTAIAAGLVIYWLQFKSIERSGIHES
ncbi:MAG TPA: APC family permease [Candidatus Binatia bacterium]|nr:APC family permease [Candidatus Binatia bacterium]